MAINLRYFAVLSVALLLSSDLLVVHGQSEWVWGKSSGSGKPTGGQNSGTSSGNSGFLNPTNYYYNTNNNNNNQNQNHNNNLNNNHNNYIGSSSNNNNGLVPVNTVTIFGSGGGGVQNSGGSASASGDKYFASQSQTFIPASANQPIIVQVLQPGSTSTNTDNKNNDVIPSNSIRSVAPANGEPRLFLSSVRNRLHKALKSLVNNNGGGGGGLGGLGGGGGGLGNLNSLIQSSSGGSGGGLSGLSGLSGLGGGGGGGGAGILNTLQQIGPLLSQGFGGRLPTVGPLPVSNSEFNTQGTSGSSSSSSGPSSSGNGNGISFINSGQSCSCVSADSCRLPNVDKGTCSGGIMCCRATGTRIVSESDNDKKDSGNSDNTRSPSQRFRVSELRTGLLAEIVRGTSTVFDDALDLILAPFLNPDDQQRLANRIASGGTRKGSKK